MKALNNINRIQFRNETIVLLLNLYESKGKQFYFDELFKKDLDSFVNLTFYEDIKYLAKILDLNLTDARLQFITKNKVSPKTKDEQLLVNIKLILNRLQTNYSRFELIVNEIHELVKRLGHEHTSVKFLTRPNLDGSILGSSKSISKREDLEKLISLYQNLEKTKKHEDITLISNFYLDYMNMEIFDNFNELSGLILLYSMLFVKFPVFKYVSFFKHYSKHSVEFKYAFEQATHKWASSFPQTDYLNEVLFSILIDSYDELEELANSYEFEVGQNKTDSIENTILKQKKLFSKSDLRKLHPTVSDSTIDRTLKRLRDENKIMPIGAGRSSKWQVLVEYKSFSQMDIFE